MAFVDPPSAGIARIRELISDLRYRTYELGGVVAALGASRCDDALELLMEIAGPDGKGVDAIGESWIEAIGMIEGTRFSEILLSFVDPNAESDLPENLSPTTATVTSWCGSLADAQRKTRRSRVSWSPSRHRIKFIRLFATCGVPLARLLISPAPSSSIFTLSRPHVLRTIVRRVALS